MQPLNMANSRLKNTKLHPEVASSRPTLAQKIIIAPLAVAKNNGEDRSDEESEGSSKDSFKSCMEDFTVNNNNDKVIIDNLIQSKLKCDHQYEVGVVVASVTSQYLHMVGPLGHVWLECYVDPLACLVFIEGVRTKEVYSVKMGAMGYMVLKECVQCQLSEETNVSPTLVWFGEEQRPSARAAGGVVVGRQGDRMVVQLEGPSAARTVRLVLFHGETDKGRDVGLETGVLVWAWTRQLGRGGGASKFLEGAAVIKEKVDEHDIDDEYVDAKQNVNQFSSEVQPSSSNRQLLRLLLHRLLYLSF